MPGLDRERVLRLFEELGERLAVPATLCLIGSTPAIATGQPGRQTADIDIWHARSEYDAGDLARACRELNVLYDPRGEIAADAIYVQVVRPGIVALPLDFDLETIGRFGKLTVAMPPPQVIAAAKLVRGSNVDIEDVVWWSRQRNLTPADIEASIDRLPSATDREAASGNALILRLIQGGT
jgi:hypothetical protein